MITHNRYLLNHCFNKILHLENTEIQEFDGNYVDYNFALLQMKIEQQELAAVRAGLARLVVVGVFRIACLDGRNETRRIGAHLLDKFFVALLPLCDPGKAVLPLCRERSRAEVLRGQLHKCMPLDVGTSSLPRRSI